MEEESIQTATETPTEASEATEVVSNDASIQAEKPEEPKEEPLSQLLQDIKTPIPGDNPVGEKLDPFDDEDLSFIKNEIDKMSLVSGGIDQEKVAERAQEILKDRKNRQATDTKPTSSISTSGGSDFKEIINRSQNILKNKSKDFLIIGYLGVALTYEEELKGMNEAFNAVLIFGEHYWENGYPPKNKMRVRGNSLNFMIPKIKDWVERYEPKMGDHVILEKVVESFKKLQEFAMKSLGEFAPATSELRQKLEQLLRKAPKPAAPKPTPTATSTSATSNTTRPAPSGGGGSASVDWQTADDVRKTMFKAAAFLRGEDAKNPVAYKLMRSTLWDGIQNDPVDGKIPPPRKQRWEFLTGVLDKLSPEDAIQRLEESLQEAPHHFCLDLQRLLVTAMEKAGEAYENAKDAILIELALLLKRVPNLPKIKFSDGTAFADMATINWIENNVFEVLGGGGGGGNIGLTAGDEDALLVAQYEEAKSKLSASNPANALAALQDGMESDISGRARFRRRFLVALLCVNGGQFRVAVPILDALQKEIDTQGLDRWEPTLALDVWSNLYKCYEFLEAEAPKDKKGDYQALTQQVFDKICKVDVRYAMALMGHFAKKRAEPEVKEEPEVTLVDTKDEASSEVTNANKENESTITPVA